MTLDDILKPEEYLYETGKLCNISPGFCGNNNAVGKHVYYNGRWEKVIQSSQKYLTLEISGRVLRKHVRIKQMQEYAPVKLAEIMSNKWGKNVEVKVTPGCSLHGDKRYHIFIDGVLEYDLPFNY